MRNRTRAIVTSVLLVTGLLVAMTPTGAAAAYADWVSVTKVQVDRLGGVNVSGQVSCAGAYQQLISGTLVYYDDDGQGHTIPWADGDRANLLANNDNYTVSQPAGRKGMIKATHGSSRMNPCYLEHTAFPGGATVPDEFRCEAGGTPCRWETDAFGYDHESLGPLFDYSPNGKFKTGLMSVTAHSVGLLVQILHSDGSLSDYFIQEGSYAMTSTTIKAVSYR